MSDMHTDSGPAEPAAEQAGVPPAAASEPASAPEPEPTPPHEIQQDVLGALDDIDQATAAGLGGGPIPTTNPEDPHAFDATFGLSSLGYDEQPSRPAVPASPLVTPRHRLEALDDLYVEHPQLKTGEYSLRIEREKPTRWGGRDCAGWIEDLHQYVTMDDFRALYGGGTYRVSVLGGDTGARNGPDGRPMRRTLDSIKITIQGVPVLRDMSNSQRDYFGGGMHPQVESKRLDIEGQERTELRQQLAQKDKQLLEAVTARGPDFEQINQYAAQQVEHVNRAHAESLGVLRTELEEKTRAIARLNQQLESQKQAYDALQNQLREEVHEERAKRIEAATREESERVKNLRAEHERELKRVQEMYSEKTERMLKEHGDRIADIQERNERLRRDDQDRAQRALESAQAEANRTVEGLERRHTQEMDHTRHMFESRISDINRAADERIKSIKETAANQLQTQQMSANIQTQSTTTLAQGQIDMARQSAESLRTELNMLRAENQSLRDQLDATHEDPLTAVTKAKGLLDTLGLSEKAESDDWRSQLAHVARNFTDKIPEVARQFAEVREHNRAANAPRQMPMQRPPHQIAAGPPPGVPRPAPIQRPRPAPPPGYDPDAGYDPDEQPIGASPLGHSGVGFAPSSAPLGAAEATGPVYRPPQPMPRGVRPPEAHQPPPQPSPQHQAPHAGPQHQPQQPQPQHQPDVQMGPPVAPEEPQGDAEHAERPSMSMPQDYPTPEYEHEQPEQEPSAEQLEAAAAFQDRAGELVDELEAAIKGGVVGPKLFADQFVKKAGPEMASALVSNLTPEGFRAALKQADTPHTQVHSRDGQKFIEVCWAEIARLLRAQQ